MGLFRSKKKDVPIQNLQDIIRDKKSRLKQEQARYISMREQLERMKQDSRLQAELEQTRQKIEEAGERNKKRLRRILIFWVVVGVMVGAAFGYAGYSANQKEKELEAYRQRKETELEAYRQQKETEYMSKLEDVEAQKQDVQMQIQELTQQLENLRQSL